VMRLHFVELSLNRGRNSGCVIAHEDARSAEIRLLARYGVAEATVA